MTNKVIKANIKVMSHMKIDEKTDNLNAESLQGLFEYGLDENGEPLRYIKFSSDKLKDLRKDAKMTQEELASELGVTRPLITQYENGTLSAPAYDILKKLGRVFSQKSGHKIVFYVDWEEEQ